jgi:REP element-mobilizing transposase RayT
MARFDPDKHHRRSIRLKGYDYALAGAYFVTIVTHERERLFDNSIFRRVVEYNWRQIPRHFPNVMLDEWIVMPNHLHVVIVIGDDDGRGEALPEGDFKGKQVAMARIDFKNESACGNASPLRSSEHPHGVERGSLGAVIGNFKSVVTRRINKIRHVRGVSIWQRNYYEHIVRDERDGQCIREYIAANPAQWEMDRENVNGRVGASVWLVDEEVWFSRIVADS